MQDNKHVDRLGSVIKSTRQSLGITQNQLAETLSITPRHLKAIENSGQKPSYDLLARIIRELDISANLVFYPLKEEQRPAKIYMIQGGRKPG